MRPTADGLCERQGVWTTGSGSGKMSDPLLPAGLMDRETTPRWGEFLNRAEGRLP